LVLSFHDPAHHPLSRWHKAVLHEDVELIETVIYSGALFFEQQPDGQPGEQYLEPANVFLFLAVLTVRPKIVYCCLARGANINALDFDGHTPLFIAAAECADILMVNLLLSLGADANMHISPCEDCMAETVLAECARRGHADVVRTLVTWTNVDLEQRGAFGMTALSYACMVGHVEGIEALLRAGANRDAQDDRGARARDFARGWGWQNCVDLLDVSSLNHAVSFSR
jgi:ankyrin repeat protein